jgi:hypothetical protein
MTQQKSKINKLLEGIPNPKEASHNKAETLSWEASPEIKDNIITTFIAKKKN